jgi:hypothetical protein
MGIGGDDRLGRKNMTKGFHEIKLEKEAAGHIVTLTFIDELDEAKRWLREIDGR